MRILRQLRATLTIASGSAAIATTVWLADRAHSSRSGRVLELVVVGVIAGLSLLVGAIGALMAARAHRLDRRRANAEHGFRTAQVELAESLQISTTAGEAFALLRRHLERTIPGSTVVVLRRDGDRDCVEPATFVPDTTVLAARLGAAPSWSCLAIRLGRSHETGGAGSPLVACSLCGASGQRSLCVPMVVTGEVVGAVLVEHQEELAEVERVRIHDSVAQSAAVLVGLRNLAQAEARSAADDLTGLPNGRSVQGSLRRMTAQAGRALSSLSVVVLDVDHLRRLNEQLGYAKGDVAVVAVAATIEELLRTSDLAGRLGGGDFVLVLPDTHKDGALEVAEKLRLAITRVGVHGLDWPLSASFGVATFPDDTVDADELLQLARAACRAAKAAGRNAVEAAGTWGVDLDLDGLDS